MSAASRVITLQRLILAGLILALGGLLAWFDWQSGSPQTIDSAARAEEPGHVVENAVLTLYDEQGNRHQRIAVEQLTHTPQHQTTQLESPRALLVDNQQREWHARAQQGYIDSQGEQLVLRGDVLLQEPQNNWQLTTQRLDYHSAEAHAFTNHPVKLEQPPQSMQAQRMDLWLNEDRLQLGGQVRGYHPTETAP